MYSDDYVSIDVLKLPLRFSNALKRAGIFTISRLNMYTYEDLLKIRGLSDVGVQIITDKLKKFISKTKPEMNEEDFQI